MNNITNMNKKRQRTQKDYKLLSQTEQCLRNPDVYVGSTTQDEEGWSYYRHGALQQLYVIPALYKLFDELIVNVQDVYMKNQRSAVEENVTKVFIKIDWNTNTIVVKNNGSGVPIEVHQQASRALQKDILCPELVFFHLNSGDNFEGDRTGGGKNGLGAKLCGIFSEKYMVKTCDGKGKQFSMTGTNNMRKMSKPKVTTPKADAFTQVSYIVDIKQFKTNGRAINTIPKDTRIAMEHRIQDLANFVDAAVWYNGKRVKRMSHKQRAVLYLGKVLFSYSDVDTFVAVGQASRHESGGTRCISYVNGTFNRRGGKHVRNISTSFHAGLKKWFREYTTANISHEQLRKRLLLFVEKKNVVNPVYDGQCKDELKSGSGIKSPFDLAEKKHFGTLRGVLKQYIERRRNERDAKEAKKSDGDCARYVNVPDLIDASKAGTLESQQCVLLVTEGKSALRMANTMIKSLAPAQQKYWGAMPIRGKFINAGKKSKADFNKNAEVQSIKKALGLKQNTRNNSQLRYGKLMIFTDQDSDGYHIRMLLISMFVTYWSQLFRSKFLYMFETPIVKAYKGSATINFYDQEIAEAHAANHTGWKYKYYKGLGTSTDSDAKAYFRNRRELIHSIRGDTELIRLCMAKGADCDAYRRLISSQPQVCTASHRGDIEFIVKKQFANYAFVANRRKIPCFMDGLIPSMRKLLAYALLHFKDNDYDHIVDRYANRAADKMGYHHGAVNLQGVVVTLASDYCGGLNLPYLYKGGQFASRHDNEFGAGRYLKTGALPHLKHLFPPQDFEFYPAQQDEGETIEPVYLCPIIPMLLVNGHRTGMGVGFKSEIPPRKIDDVIQMVLDALQDIPVQDVPVHFNHFTGKVYEDKTSGAYHLDPHGAIVVTELPIGVKTDNFLKAVKKETRKVEFADGHGDGDRIHLVIRDCSEAMVQKWLTRSMQENWVVFEKNNKIVELDKKDAYKKVLHEFMQVRLEIYQQRKQKMVQTTEHIIATKKVQARVISTYVNDQWAPKMLTDHLEATLTTINEGFEHTVTKRDLDVSVFQLNAKRHETLRKEIEEKQGLLATIRSRTEKELWREDLHRLKESLH